MATASLAFALIKPPLLATSIGVNLRGLGAPLENTAYFCQVALVDGDISRASHVPVVILAR